MKDMVAQKENLERKKKEVEALRKEEELQKENVRQQAKERVLNGLASGNSVFSSGALGKRKERDDDGEYSNQRCANARVFTRNLL